jgi:DNA-binding transcriptional LysR family regulator
LQTEGCWEARVTCRSNLGTYGALRVAERCGSFRKTADLLALKQSNLSRRVRHLEEQLGIALFERMNGGVRPTAAGRDFADGVRRVLNELQIVSERATSRPS